MTEEEKRLLLQDLSARLPYKVRCECINGLGGGKTDRGVLKFIGNCNGVISNYYEDIPIDSGFVNNVFYPIENIKPYLRPMSSITDEERLELSKLTDDNFKFYLYTYKPEIICYEKYNYLEGLKVLEWLNTHHFDYRGLIEMDLALEAPEGMYDDKK